MNYYTQAVLEAKNHTVTKQQLSLIQRDSKVNNYKERLKKREATQGLSEILTEGAKKHLTDVLEEERESFLERKRYEHKSQAQSKGYRNGYSKERKLCTGRGTITINAPRVRNTKEPFRSNILLPYQSQTTEVVDLLPDLYLHGLSTGDFETALSYFLGNGASLSPNAIIRLKEKWAQEYKEWCSRLLQSTYAYIWADGLFVKVGSCKDKLAILVVLGVNEDGRKELLAALPGYRENESNWRDVMRSLRARGLDSIKLLIGDGLTALWNVVREIYPGTPEQRCWVHKMINVLSKVPKSVEAEVLKSLQTIYQATTKVDAIAGFIKFSEQYHHYPLAVKCLLENQAELTTYFDFPKEHWDSIKTTNPIESMFAPVRSRLVVAKRIINYYSALGLVHQLLLQREVRFRRLPSPYLIANVITGVQYQDGIENKKRK
jgi:putative transposase